MSKKIISVLWPALFALGVTFAAGADKPAQPWVTPETLTIRETINISGTITSYDELLAVISDCLNKVCATVYLTIKNTKQWFSEHQMDQCINQALQNSSLVGPYCRSYKYFFSTVDNLHLKMKLQLIYRFPRKTLLRYITETELKATAIVNALLTPDMTDYQKELALHDYIVNHARYDDVNDRQNTLPDESYTPYGVLIRGTGVCSGYAHAVRLLFQKAGIKCILVSGMADGREHAWNIVNIGGEYYHLDVTWDDPVGKDQLRYHYFNLSDDLIAVNHTWDVNRYPRCNATEYNYYRRNGLWIENMTEFHQRLQDAVTSKAANINLKIADFNPANFDKTLYAMLTGLAFVGRYEYSLDEALGIVEIKFTYAKD